MPLITYIPVNLSTAFVCIKPTPSPSCHHQLSQVRERLFKPWPKTSEKGFKPQFQRCTR